MNQDSRGLLHYLREYEPLSSACLVSITLNKYSFCPALKYKVLHGPDMH